MEEILKKVIQKIKQNSIITITVLIIIFGLAFQLDTLPTMFGMFVLFIAFFLIVYLYLNIKSIKEYNKSMKPYQFKEIENYIGKYYKVLEFPIEEFNIFNKEAQNVSYDKYFIEKVAVKGGYISPEIRAIVKKPNIDIPKIELKYVTEFERKQKKIYMMFFEEKIITDSSNTEPIIINNYVLIYNSREFCRFHIHTKPHFIRTDIFEKIYYNYEEDIKNNTYEIYNEFLELTEHEKKFLVDLYNESGFEYSIVMKDGKTYITISIRDGRMEENTPIKIAEFFMKMLEEFRK